MITRLSDGFTLQYTDASGQQRQIGIYDPDYFQVLATFELQQDAQRQNTQAFNGYNLTIHVMQAALAAGQPMGAAPPKPLMIVVDDQGNTSHLPWSPPLADPPAPTRIASGDGSQIKTAAAPDRTDVLLSIATAQAAAIAQLQRDVAAIKARVQA